MNLLRSACVALSAFGLAAGAPAQEIERWRKVAREANIQPEE